MYEVAEGGFLDIDVKVYNPVNKVMYDQQRETSGKVSFKLNQLSQLLDRILMEHLESKYSLRPKLFFVSICSV